MASNFGLPDTSPTKYLGITENVVPLFRFCRRPVATDRKYRIGTFVLLCGDTSTGTAGELWYLKEFLSGVPQWVQLSTGGASPGIDTVLTDDGAPSVGPDSSGILTITGGTGIITSGQDPATTVTLSVDTTLVTTSYLTDDANTATPAAGEIVIAGGVGIDTSSSGSTITIDWNSSVTAQTYNADTGSAAPAAGVLTVMGGTGITTSGSGSTLTIDVDTAVITTSYLTDDTNSATPAAGVITVTGGTGIDTSSSGSTITIDWNSSVTAQTYHTDGSDATPAAGAITVMGGTGITTSGSGSTITIDADTSVLTTSYLTDDTNSATPAAGVITVTGGTGITTSSSGSTITLVVDTSVVTTSFLADDTNSATPAAGVITVTGGTGITTSASGSTLTITASTAAGTITGDDAVALSPTGGNWDIVGSTVANATNAKPLYTSGSVSTLTAEIQVAAAVTGAPADKNDAGLVSLDDNLFSVDTNGYATMTGNDGEVVIGSTAGAPQFASITSTDGSIIWTAGSNTLDASAVIGGNSANGAFNLGISLSSGTFTIKGANGNNLSASNTGQIVMPSSTFGQNKMYTITANQSFADATAGGGSDIIGNLFGLTTGVAETNDVPFYIYAVSDSTETDIAFGISRIPNLVLTPAAGNLGSPSSATADVQQSVFFFNSVTLSSYAARPVICIGAFRMTMSASDDWTVSALSADDGIGQFLEATRFQHGAGQYGANAGKYFFASTQTPPTYTDNFATYSITKNGYIHIRLAFITISVSGTGGERLFYMAPLARQFFDEILDDALGALYVAAPGTKTGAIRTDNNQPRSCIFIIESLSGGRVLNSTNAGQIQCSLSYQIENTV